MNGLLYPKATSNQSLPTQTILEILSPEGSTPFSLKFMDWQTIL